MEPASSKLLLWLLSFARERESSSSEAGTGERKDVLKKKCVLKDVS